MKTKNFIIKSTFLFIFFHLTGLNIISAQIDTHPRDEEIFMMCEDMPRFPGCEEKSTKREKESCAQQKLLDYIYSNLKYPKEALDNKIEGKVIMRFVVEKNGTIGEVEILTDIGGGCGNEAKRVIESMNDLPEKWIAGKQGGRNVNCFFTVPIIFKLVKK